MLSLKVIGPHHLRWVAESGQWVLVPNQDFLTKEAVLNRFPFVIGRAEDCTLTLPQNDGMEVKASRWHCHIQERQGECFIMDGSLGVVKEAGKPKPSAAGTMINGQKITIPTRLKPGDHLQIGPWQFEVKEALGVKVDAAGVMEAITSGRGRRQLDPANPKLKEKFGQMHELVRRLAQIPDVEESLITLLGYCTSKIEAAEVAAILLAKSDGGFATRLAWQKGMGRVPEFHFSQKLLESLPADHSYLLESALKDRSESQSAHDISSGLLVPLWGKGERLGVLYLDNRRNAKSFGEEDLYLASAIASLVSLQIALNRQSELGRIKENMARYFAPDVVERIVEESASGQSVGLEVQEKLVAVLFVDMEGFTAMSHTKTPKEIAEILNPYFETLAFCIQSEGGHVNKFIGDAVMGIFGANPGEGAQLKPAEIAAQAARAALAMLKRWPEVATERGLPQKRLRIGINVGRAVVGNIGYSQRLEYSVLGDPVNVASRMEHLAPPNKTAVSEETKKLLEDLFEFEDAGEQEVKGVGKVHVYVLRAPLAVSDR